MMTLLLQANHTAAGCWEEREENWIYCSTTHNHSSIYAELHGPLACLARTARLGPTFMCPWSVGIVGIFNGMHAITYPEP
jgi:hypothetical protein